MKLVVGLGNPGPSYAGTRHNVGFRVVERFARSAGIELRELRFRGRFGRGRWRDSEVAVLEPQTTMNRSGDAVAAALAALPPLDPGNDVLVVFDDLDLPFGRLRLRPSGGAGGHRGLADILAALGHESVARLRFGIGRPPAGRDPVEYVLELFAPHEERQLEERLAAAADAVELALAGGVVPAMGTVNRAEPES
ncbi:MAG: aminoacyl-tRNA hydrolase [Proteobacteria bacterium]|nr:aminoacyl-tRNA hydrolase [Pseudomonadota bacterium]